MKVTVLDDSPGSVVFYAETRQDTLEKGYAEIGQTFHWKHLRYVDDGDHPLHHWRCDPHGKIFILDPAMMGHTLEQYGACEGEGVWCTNTDEDFFLWDELKQAAGPPGSMPDTQKKLQEKFDEGKKYCLGNKKENNAQASTLVGFAVYTGLLNKVMDGKVCPVPKGSKGIPKPLRGNDKGRHGPTWRQVGGRAAVGICAKCRHSRL